MNHTARPYHAVRFYENEKSLARIVGEFLAKGLTGGEPGIVVATPVQRAAIVRDLIARGVDVMSLEQSGDLVLLDAEDTLASFLTNDELDASAFNDVMRTVIERACRGRTDCTVRIYGAMVDVLWKAGKRDLAIRLEMLWNELAHTQLFALLCGYAMGPFYKAAHFEDVCGQHTHVLSADGTAAAVAADASVGAIGPTH
ncbi:MAG: MEDS domain-containing protein [Vicinamibacterales bacterium]